jgi:hypothetical protein
MGSDVSIFMPFFFKRKTKATHVRILDLSMLPPLATKSIIDAAKES